MIALLGLALALIVLQAVLVGLLLWRYRPFAAIEREPSPTCVQRYHDLEARLDLLEQRVPHGRG